MIYLSAIYYTKFKENRNVSAMIIGEVFLFIISMFIFLSVLFITPPKITGGYEECDETYYVIGKTTKFKDDACTEKSLYYMVTEKELDPDEKIDYYDYYYLPVDSFNVTYGKGDRIVMDHTNNMLKHIKYTNARTDMDFTVLVYFIMFCFILVVALIFTVAATS